MILGKGKQRKCVVMRINGYDSYDNLEMFFMYCVIYRKKNW